MTIEFIITIFTMIIGFLGVILTIISLNNGLRSENNSLRSELKAEISRLENRFEDDIKELRGLILGLYSPRLFKNVDDKDAG